MLRARRGRRRPGGAHDTEERDNAERSARAPGVRHYQCNVAGDEAEVVRRVADARSWACWKTYVGRPETDELRVLAMGVLGGGLSYAGHHEDALSVREAELSMLRRLGAPAQNILVALGNLANAYARLGRKEDALLLKRDVYSGTLKRYGEEHYETLREASNYAASLVGLHRHAEARSLLRKTIPVARRVLGESDDLTLRMRSNYVAALVNAGGATLDDLREAVTTLEDTERIARRVLGGAHPDTTRIENALRSARAVLRARETPPTSA